MASIAKYSFLSRLIWALIRPMVKAAADDDTDDFFTSEMVDLIDSIIAMNFEEIAEM